MNPFMMVDWHRINQIFCLFMWVLVLVLAMVVFTYALPHGTTAVGPVHAILR